MSLLCLLQVVPSAAALRSVRCRVNGHVEKQDILNVSSRALLKVLQSGLCCVMVCKLSQVM